MPQEAVEGAGVLAPPHQHEAQHGEPAAEREPQLGLDDDDVGLQYPMESGKGQLSLEEGTRAGFSAGVGSQR